MILLINSIWSPSCVHYLSSLIIYSLCKNTNKKNSKLFIRVADFLMNAENNNFNFQLDFTFSSSHCQNELARMIHCVHIKFDLSLKAWSILFSRLIYILTCFILFTGFGDVISKNCKRQKLYNFILFEFLFLLFNSGIKCTLSQLNAT